MNAQLPAKIKNQRSEPQNSPSEVRAAYPFFHEKRTKNSAGMPYTYPAGHPKAGQPNPRYNATFMFPKLAADAAHCPNYNWLWSLAVEAAKKQWPGSVDAAGNWAWPHGAQLPIKDGDVPFVSKPKPGVQPPTAEQIAAKNAWRKGYWIIEAENYLDPGPRIAKIVNGIPTELPAKTINGVVQYKSGDFGYVNLHAYGYENSTFGINYGFDGFCFTREGDPIGSQGPRSTAAMFGSVAGMVSPASVVQPAGVAPQMYVAPAPTHVPAAAPQPQYAAPVAPQPPAPPAPVAAPPLAPAAAAPPAPPMPPAPPAAPTLPAFPTPQ